MLQLPLHLLVLLLVLSVAYDSLSYVQMGRLLGVLQLPQLILRYYIPSRVIIVLPLHPHIGAWRWKQNLLPYSRTTLGVSFLLVQV
jgi:hypothetical protein